MFSWRCYKRSSWIDCDKYCETDPIKRWMNVYRLWWWGTKWANYASFYSLLPLQKSRTDKYGLSGDDMEALAFAWLAARTIAKWIRELPSVTGASEETVLGAFTLQILVKRDMLNAVSQGSEKMNLILLMLLIYAVNIWTVDYDAWINWTAISFVWKVAKTGMKRVWVILPMYCRKATVDENGQPTNVSCY